MTEFDVKVVELPAMKAASFYGFGKSPEPQAHDAAISWLKKHNLFKQGAYRNFGFNNPNPSAGSQNYGYEVWIVPTNGLPEGHGAKEVEFEGGLYAVAYCPSLDVIGEIWQMLVAWRDGSEYQPACHQWLEEAREHWLASKPADHFDLYLPIAK
ncbi:MAG: effector binding domain-containing protein [Anaerolineales bacterium]|nr:effector binding domain-containing protein [Anaerolineales bacterium]